MALQTAKQAFEQHRTQELQQVMGGMHCLHQQCNLATLCCDVLGHLSYFQVVSSLQKCSHIYWQSSCNGPDKLYKQCVPSSASHAEAMCKISLQSLVVAYNACIV